MTEEQRQLIDGLRRGGYGYRQISHLTGISVNSIKSYCRRCDADSGTGAVTRMVAPAQMGSCENCGATIRQTPGKRRRRFCSDHCRCQWWNRHPDLVNRKANYECVCRYCGKSFLSYGNRNRKYCSRECYRKDRFGGDDHDDSHK